MTILITKSKILQGEKPANAEVMNKPVFSKCRPDLYFGSEEPSFISTVSLRKFQQRGLEQILPQKALRRQFQISISSAFIFSLCMSNKEVWLWIKKKKKKLNHLLNVEKSVKNPVVFNWSSKLSKEVAEETVLGFRFGWRQRNEVDQGRMSRRMWVGGRSCWLERDV